MQCSNASSVKSLAVDQGRMKTVGDSTWLAPVLRVPISALILLIGWQEGNLSLSSLLLLPAGL